MQFGKSSNIISMHLFTKLKNTLKRYVFNIKKINYLIIGEGNEWLLNYNRKVSQSSFRILQHGCHDYMWIQMFVLIARLILLKSSVNTL